MAAPRQVVLKNEHVTIWFYPDTRIVHHRFHKFTVGQPLRDALDAGTAALQRFDAHKWLSDDRNLSALPEADVEWGRTEWFPRTIEAGWKAWALVLPQTIVGQMNLKRVAAEYAEHGLTANVFTDPIEALAWLERI